MQSEKRLSSEILNRITALFILVSFSVFVLFLGFHSYGIYLDTPHYAMAMNGLAERNTVIIDAGHGGEDPGAIGINGVYEKDINLSISIFIGELLINEGFAVIYTRTTDRMLYGVGENVKGARKISDLKNRCKIAAEYPEALFISVHMNSYSQEKYSGFQAYYSLNNENSISLAREITASVKKDLQPKNGRVEKSGENIYLLRNIDNAAVLLECGFLTNTEECQKLSEKEYQKLLSLAIVYGIINYRNKALEI